MSRMSTEPVRHALNGPTMGTRWSAVIHAEPGLDPESVRQALAAAVAEVDAQMSTWTPDSDLMRLNRAPAGAWCSCCTTHRAPGGTSRHPPAGWKAGT